MTKTLFATLAATALVTACNKQQEAPSDSIGAAECDEYAAKLEACIATNPALKTALSDTLKQNQQSWKTKASSPEHHASLQAACKSAIDTLAASCP